MGVSRFDSQYPETLRSDEKKLLDARREKTGERGPYIGLALSGGGIRSATFCLGVLQALAESRNSAGIRLRSIDVLSTVSGGSYVGSFFGALFCRGRDAEWVEQQLTNPRSTPVHWLRENGRYLAPNGAGDEWLAGAAILRNWTAVAFVMSILVLAVLMLGHSVDLGVRTLAARYPDLGLRVDVLSAAWQGIYWSPFFAVALAMILFFAAPLSWAYWLGRFQPSKGEYLFVWVSTVLVLLASIGLAMNVDSRWAIVVVIAAETLLIAVCLTIFANGSAGGSTASRRFRNLATRYLAGMLMCVAFIALVAVMDTIGRTAYMAAIWKHRIALPAAFVSAVTVLLTVVRKLTAYLSTDREKKHVTIPLRIIGSLAGIVVAVLLASALSTVSYGIARGFGAHKGCPAALEQPCRQADVPVPPPLPRTPAAAVSLVFLTWLLGQSLPFVNLSSLTQFYSARLSRTFVGASNANRQGKTTTEEVAGDDFELAAYEPHAAGGPLHLINVTLNETVGGASQVLDRDRKGLSMAVGPAGMSVGVTHHAVWNDGRKKIVSLSPPAGVDAQYRIWPAGKEVSPKPLSLSQWTAISGAAVATGMGAQTGLGLSLLLGMANVRLGYWWDSAVDPATQGGTKPSLLQRSYAWSLPVQSALTDEFLAQFRGPHQRNWYLTDGGHFENTAVYELVRRRLPIILVCDDGADSEYGYEDLANLVRKAQIDFDTRIEFLNPEASQKVLGTLDDLKPQADRGRNAGSELRVDLGMKLQRHHLLIATVTYPDSELFGEPFLAPHDGRGRSLLVVIKPSLTGDEPLDILQYAAANVPFPQQTTADQFFDEAQWESYRKLGHHIGGRMTSVSLDALRDAVSTARS